MAPIAAQSPPIAETTAFRKAATSANVSPPDVQLNRPVFVHAPSKHKLESHTTIETNSTNLDDATTVCAWVFDSTIPHSELTAALGQMLQNHPVYSGRIVEISSDGHVKIELSNEGVPLCEGKAPAVTIKDLVPCLAEEGNKKTNVSAAASSSSSLLASHAVLTALLPAQLPLTTEALRNQRAPLVVASHVVLADGATALAVRVWSHLFADCDGAERFLSAWRLPGSVTPVACCVLADGKAAWRKASASVEKPAVEVKVIGQIARNTDARDTPTDYELV
ncbi:hypothetical protein HDU87_005115 [Geranomyces variabilis]|uniref:Uncharacterized protein n=1 Tax=Geranomyces variabilis TaxID=109894 RepID=A0AAD5XVF1_9FUNG|nr:hypothetical protein HDU87_005115 [Geranomyces variabilis]